MKITKSRLKKIITEEILREAATTSTSRGAQYSMDWKSASTKTAETNVRTAESDKVTKHTDKEEKKVDNDLDKIVEVISTLRTQLAEHLRQEQHHHTMVVKAQGALEVLLQLHPQEEENK